MAPQLTPSEGMLEPVDQLDSRQFLIAVRRLADSLNYGTDHSPFLGSGLEYVQSRLYQPGDPIKTIDWRVTARTGKWFVKEYEAPKRLPVYLILDTSASMTVSSVKHSKYARGIQIAGALAFACLDRISPVGLIGAGESAISVRPSLAKDRVMQWLHELRRFRWNEATLLGQRLAELASSLPSRAVVIVISDMHDPQALPIIRRMGQKHDCCVIQMRDPAESGISKTGFYRAREAESGRTMVAHGNTQWTDQDTLKQMLKRAGIDLLTIDTDQPISHRLRRFFADRGLLGRGAR